MAEQKIGGAYGDIRVDISIDALNAYLTTNVAEISAPVVVKQFQYGQSNPTYFLTDARGTRFVLRKKPVGMLLSPTAHAVEREYQVLFALHTHNQNPSTDPSLRIPIPRPIALCEDRSIVGTPFYIMEFLEGRIFADVKMPQLPPVDRKACWLSAIRTLGLLSSLNPDAIGLGSFGSHSPYYPRQLKSLSRVSKAQALARDVESDVPVGDMPFFAETMHWYATHLPDERRFGTRIVHGDYKIDNLVFHPTEPRVIGILDWELCTLGHPLADLGNLMLPYALGPSVGPSGLTSEGFRGSPPDTVPLTDEEVVREYCRVTKIPYPIEEMTFVRSWMIFRLGIILQGVAARAARGQASSTLARVHGSMFPLVGHIARGLIFEGEKAAADAKL